MPKPLLVPVTDQPLPSCSKVALGGTVPAPARKPRSPREGNNSVFRIPVIEAFRIPARYDSRTCQPLTGSSATGDETHPSGQGLL